ALLDPERGRGCVSPVAATDEAERDAAPVCSRHLEARGDAAVDDRDDLIGDRIKPSGRQHTLEHQRGGRELADPAAPVGPAPGFVATRRQLGEIAGLDGAGEAQAAASAYLS